MKNELPSRFLEDGSIDLGNGAIGPSSADKDYFNSRYEAQALNREITIPIRHDSRLGRTLGLRFGSLLFPTAGTLSLLAVACSTEEVKQGQQEQPSGSELPSSPPETVIFSPATPKPSPTEIPIPPTQTADIEARARQRLAERIAQIQANAVTPTPPPPTETPTPFPTQTPEATPTPEVKKAHVVRPVLFVPSDLSEQPDDLENINKAMEEIKRFYAEQLNGKTFKPEKAVKVRGQYDLRYYCPDTTFEKHCNEYPGKEVKANSPDIVGNVLSDIKSQDPTLFNKGQVIAVFMVGGSGLAKGSSQSPDYGYAFFGGWTLDAFGNRFASNTYTSNCFEIAMMYCKDGTHFVDHELGHAFGIYGHPRDDGSKKGDANFIELSVMNRCMDPDPNCKFLDSAANPEKQTLLQSPFIK